MSDNNHRKRLGFHILTLGCPKNSVDSSKLQRRLEAEGFVQTDENFADILLINTCAFIQDAKEESIRETLRLARLKDSCNQKRLILFGCLGQRYSDELKRELPEVDLIEGIGSETSILNYLKEITPSMVRFTSTDKTCITSKNPATYAYLKIAEGCSRRCSYCVIPSIRGKFRSVDRDTLLMEACELINSGAKELILIGQDITAYGMDRGDYRLIELLKDLSLIEGDFLIRLMYLNPEGITDELIDHVASNPKVIKYLDIPLQHSEDRILRLMARRGSKKEYLRLIRRIRRVIPEVTLRTTFIVGFPTETEEEFQSLIDFVEEVRFDRLGAFIYSREEGTPSAKLKGQIPKHLKQKRYDTLMGTQAEISYQKNLELLGRVLPAVVEEIDSLAIIARLHSQAPEIDGAVIIDLRQETKPDKINIGDRIYVEITGAYEYDLLGRIRQGL